MQKSFKSRISGAACSVSPQMFTNSLSPKSVLSAMRRVMAYFRLPFLSGECRILWGVGVDTEALWRDGALLCTEINQSFYISDYCVVIWIMFYTPISPVSIVHLWILFYICEVIRCLSFGITYCESVFRKSFIENVVVFIIAGRYGTTLTSYRSLWRVGSSYPTPYLSECGVLYRLLLFGSYHNLR